MSTKLVIDKKYCLYFLMAVGFFLPEYLKLISPVYRFSQLCALISYIAIFLILFITKHKVISIVGVLSILFYIEIIIVTLVNNEYYFYESIRYALPVIAIVLYFMIIDYNKKKIFIHALFDYHYIVMWINFFTVLICKEGLYSTESIELYFFLGHNNSAVKFLLPCIVYAMIYDTIKKGIIGWRTYSSIFVSMITVVLTWSNTAMIGIGVLLLYSLLFLKKKYEVLLRKIITAKNCFIISIVIFVSIVVLGNVGFLAPFVEGVLGKTVTFSGRTLIWSKTLDLIMDKPIFGYGYVTYFGDYVMLNKYAPSAAHNYFLDVLFRGGGLLLIILAIIIFQLCRGLDREKTVIARSLTIALLAYFIMWQFEVFINYGYIDMFLVFCVISEHKKLVESNSECI